MNTIQLEKTTIISDFDNNLEKIAIQLTNLNFENQNIILDLSDKIGLKPKNLNVFLNISKSINTNKNSFVIVVSDFDFNKAPTKINVVPSIQEAYDIIEMEEIERDLGF